MASRKGFAGAVDGVTVGATTTVVLAASRTRIRAILGNDGTETIYAACGADAVMNKGLVIPQGTTYVLTEAVAGLAINAICSSGSMNLSVQTFGTNG